VISEKKAQKRWCLWFFAGNILLFWLIGLNYLSVIPWFGTEHVLPKGEIILGTFAAFCYIGELGLLALLPCVFMLPLIHFFPKRKFVFALSILIAVLMSTFLLTDSFVYKLYRFHVNGIMIHLVTKGLGEEVLGVSQKEFVISTLALLAIFSSECIYAKFLWNFLQNKKRYFAFKWLIIFLAFNLYLSYCMIAYSSGFLINRVMIDISRFVPFYTETFSCFFPSTKDVLEHSSEQYLAQPDRMNIALNYPLHTIKFSQKKPQQNLLIIVIDTWRYDMLNSLATPHLTEFAKNALVFTHHISGGNSTGPGIFSLFYGLPATYATAMEKQARGPVLIDSLIQKNYRVSAFSSAELYTPPLNKTVLLSIKSFDPHQQLADTPYGRDQLVTKKFEQFIATQSSKPFFSFLLYDSAHTYCGFLDDLKPLQPVVKNCNRMELNAYSDPIPYLNRYQNALMLVDTEINKVLTALKKEHLLENTVVIITGDHGEEFNDNHLGYWGHASNFTRYQIQTPLIVYWPGKKPQILTYETSHFDIAPTLMKHLLFADSSFQDYSVGTDLFSPTEKNYHLISSYIALGIVEPDRITEVTQSGHFQMKKLNDQPASFGINPKTMQQAFSDMRKYFNFPQ